MFKLVQKVCGPGQLILLGFQFTSSITIWIMALHSLKEIISVAALFTVFAFSVAQKVTFWSLCGEVCGVLFKEKEIVEKMRHIHFKSASIAIEVSLMWSNLFNSGHFTCILYFDLFPETNFYEYFDVKTVNLQCQQCCDIKACLFAIG